MTRTAMRDRQQAGDSPQDVAADAPAPDDDNVRSARLPASRPRIYHRSQVTPAREGRSVSGTTSSAPASHWAKGVLDWPGSAGRKRMRHARARQYNRQDERRQRPSRAAARAPARRRGRGLPRLRAGRIFAGADHPRGRHQAAGQAAAGTISAASARCLAPAPTRSSARG